MKKINLIKFKDRIAFSLIELMVSMVVISVIMAAFTPIITKRTKANTVAMKLGDAISATKCETWINPNCRVCLRKRCVLCNDDLKCSASQYLYIDNCSCHSCSEYNSSCISCSVSKCKACSGGNGYSSSAPYCTQCKIGTYSDGTTACKVPNDGWYTDTAGASAPKPCEEGSMCKNGIKTTCKNGSWSAAQSSSCNAKCPEGYYCQNGVKTVCPAGKWSNAGSSTCGISCPAGYSCANGSKTACPSGTYSTGGAASCTNCSAGYACSPTGQKICSAGTYAAAGATSCTTCPAGTYNKTAGSASCAACGDGYYCSGGSNRVACSTLGCGGCNAATGGCTSCAPGTYKNGAVCTVCPDFNYCPDGVNIKPCSIEAVCDIVKGPTKFCLPGEYGTRTGCVSCAENCAKCQYYSGIGEVFCTACRGDTTIVNNAKKPYCGSCNDAFSNNNDRSWAINGQCVSCDSIIGKSGDCECEKCTPIYSYTNSYANCTKCSSGCGFIPIRNSSNSHVIEKNCYPCPKYCKSCEYKERSNGNFYPYCTQCDSVDTHLVDAIIVRNSTSSINTKICLPTSLKESFEKKYKSDQTSVFNYFVKDNGSNCGVTFAEPASTKCNNYVGSVNCLECINYDYENSNGSSDDNWHYKNGCNYLDSGVGYYFKNDIKLSDFKQYAVGKESDFRFVFECGDISACVSKVRSGSGSSRFDTACHNIHRCREYKSSTSSLSSSTMQYCLYMGDLVHLN